MRVGDAAEEAVEDRDGVGVHDAALVGGQPVGLAGRAEGELGRRGGRELRLGAHGPDTRLHGRARRFDRGHGRRVWTRPGHLAGADGEHAPALRLEPDLEVLPARLADARLAFAQAIVRDRRGGVVEGLDQAVDVDRLDVGVLGGRRDAGHEGRDGGCAVTGRPQRR